MGGSGAGKTTFMDVIANRKTIGYHKGQILINGHEVEPVAWSRNLGYVEQMDIHSPQLTVKESLEVSARLRLPRATSEAALQHQLATTLQMVRRCRLLTTKGCDHKTPRHTSSEVICGHESRRGHECPGLEPLIN